MTTNMHIFLGNDMNSGRIGPNKIKMSYIFIITLGLELDSANIRQVTLQLSYTPQTEHGI